MKADLSSQCESAAYALLRLLSQGSRVDKVESMTEYVAHLEPSMRFQVLVDSPARWIFLEAVHADLPELGVLLLSELEYADRMAILQSLYIGILNHSHQNKHNELQSVLEFIGTEATCQALLSPLDERIPWTLRHGYMATPLKGEPVGFFEVLVRSTEDFSQLRPLMNALFEEDLNELYQSQLTRNGPSLIDRLSLYKQSSCPLLRETFLGYLQQAKKRPNDVTEVSSEESEEDEFFDAGYEPYTPAHSGVRSRNTVVEDEQRIDAKRRGRPLSMG